MKTLFKGMILIGVTLGCIWGASLIWAFERKDLCFIIGAIYILVGSTSMVGNMEGRPRQEESVDVSLEGDGSDAEAPIVRPGTSFVGLMMSSAVVVIVMGVFWR
ncbi:MAG: hypothetical protein ACRCW2_03255 [Cellulosilyticaceae bacterium]